MPIFVGFICPPPSLWCLTPEFVNDEQIPNLASKIQRQTNISNYCFQNSKTNCTDKTNYTAKYKFIY
ncbi:MAG: hypothetical protein HDT25_06250 [Ruminococcus sp.]|nr:hypothetical protein [Ruminococcus sp.]